MVSDSVICMPTLRRPEFLALALEKISQTKEAPNLDVRIFLDYGVPARLADVEFCRDTFLPTAEIYQANPHKKVLSGTWNILNALKSGWESGAKFIFLVEEDVMIRPEFFQWHWSAHEQDDYFVTCGRRYSRMPLDFYSNPGTCYRRDKLALVMPHIREEYFNGTDAYVDKYFPQFKGMDGSLDDGLIRKIIRSVGGKVMCAEPKVCAHQGFHYYDRLENFKNTGKTIQERIEMLRVILKRVKEPSRYTGDFEPL